MTTRFGRFFLLIFIWLQCLAPLLHAHAGEPGHFGLHLPGAVGVKTPGMDTSELDSDRHTTAQQVLCVSNATRVNQGSAVIANPPLISALSLTSVTFIPAWSATPHLDPPPLQISRQQPLPGAPPCV